VVTKGSFSGAEAANYNQNQNKKKKTSFSEAVLN
jgi:hypothetical protein